MEFPEASLRVSPFVRGGRVRPWHGGHLHFAAGELEMQEQPGTVATPPKLHRNGKSSLILPFSKSAKTEWAKRVSIFMHGLERTPSRIKEIWK